MATSWSEQLIDEDAVRQRLVAAWPEISGWIDRLNELWQPNSGSELEGDDLAAPVGVDPSQQVWLSLYNGVECLMSATTYMVNCPGTLFSMHSVLRSAMLGTAQCVWLLENDLRDERVARAAKVHHDAVAYQYNFVKSMRTAEPGTLTAPAGTEAALLGQAGGTTKMQVKPTQVVRAAAGVAFDTPSMVQAAMGAWQVSSCVAHALPWEFDMRPSVVDERTGASRTGASHTDLQAVWSNAHAFATVGWRLLQQRNMPN